MKNYIKFLVLMAAFLFLVSVSVLKVNAEETGEKETENTNKYSYTVVYNYTADNYGINANAVYTYKIYSEKPVYIYYRYTDEPATYPEFFCGDLENIDEYFGGTYGYNFSYSGFVKYGNGTTGIPKTLYTSAFVYKGVTRYTITTDCPIFSSREAMQNYIKTGDESGWINKPEDIKYDNFYLLGFQCDSSIRASWQGINTDLDIDLAKVEIQVKPTYYFMLESGEEEQAFSSPGTISVPYIDGSFYKSYSDYYKNNPYAGRSELYLTFTPVYKENSATAAYYGRSIIVVIDKNGEITDLNSGASTVPVYDNDFYLLNFTSVSEFHNFGDSFIYAYWTGSSIDSTVEYLYSDIKIQLYCNDGVFDSQLQDSSFKWIDYKTDDIFSINSKTIKFNLTVLADYCNSQGYYWGKKNYRGNYTNEVIRLIPYYVTRDGTYYGRAVEISLSALGGVKSTMQVEGDVLSEDSDYLDRKDLTDDYYTDHSPIGDLVDDIISGNTADMDINSLTFNFFALLKTMLQACGQFPALVANVFSFLPGYYSSMLIVGLGLIILLRILGR